MVVLPTPTGPFTETIASGAERAFFSLAIAVAVWGPTNTSEPVARALNGRFVRPNWVSYIKYPIRVVAGVFHVTYGSTGSLEPKKLNFMELGHKKTIFGRIFIHSYQTEQKGENSIQKAQNTRPFAHQLDSSE